MSIFHNGLQIHHLKFHIMKDKYFIENNKKV